jgi:hypothetical protein
MRKALLAAISTVGLAISPAAAIEPVVDPGEEIEARVEGDLNGDGTDDLAYVVSTDDWRELRVVLSYRSDVDFGFEAPEALDLEPTMLGPGSLSIDGKVLKFDDLTGGTTAISSTRRFRYDSLRKRMRLIGLDATLYSRTNAHDGFEASWNLLNGDAVTRELRLVEGAGEDPYANGRERRFKHRIRPQWLADSPDPETMLEEMRQD